MSLITSIRKILHEKAIRLQVRKLCFPLTPDKVLLFTEKNQQDVDIIKDELRLMRRKAIHEGWFSGAESLSELLGKPLSKSDHADIFEGALLRGKLYHLRILERVAKEAEIEISAEHLKQMISNCIDRSDPTGELIQLKKEYAKKQEGSDYIDPFLKGKELLSS